MPEDKDEPYELFIPGCLFIGIAMGFLYDEIIVGTLLGLGAGFLLMGLGMSLSRRSD